MLGILLVLATTGAEQVPPTLPSVAGVPADRATDSV